ncbi:MAG: hypothetical protein JEZ03_14685, partial [Bacteroidales bacterium]|nr:hypothetical protein [Bacteroidales bacterium]
MKRLFIIYLLSFLSNISFSQVNPNNFCDLSLPFCTGIEYVYPMGYGGGSLAEEGPEYGCLGAQPNPSWFYCKIEQAGDMTIKIWAEPETDMDFVCWGPFDDPTEPCPFGLTENLIQDCSISSITTEYCDIENAQTDKYYILLISNWDGTPCDLHFAQTAGSAATDCGIVFPEIDSNDPVCVGNTLELTTGDFENCTFAWTGPNGFTSSNQTITFPNCNQTHAGEYSLIVTQDGLPSEEMFHTVISAGTNQTIDYGTSTLLNGSLNGSSSLFEIHWEPSSLLITPTNIDPTTANLTATTVFELSVSPATGGCTVTDQVVVTVEGNPLEFEVNATDTEICVGEEVNINVDVQNSTGDVSFLWSSLPVGFTSTNATITVSPDVTTVYTVQVSDAATTLTESVTIIANPLPQINAGTDQTVGQGGTANLNGTITSNPSEYSFSWQPDNLVTNPGQLSTPTLALNNTTTFTLSATHNTTGCSNTDQLTVEVLDNLSVSINWVGDFICQGDPTSLTATANGGSGNYTYSWVSNPVGFTSNQASITLNPTQTTNYTVTVNDGFGTASASQTVDVTLPPTLDAGVDTTLCDIPDFVINDATASNYTSLNWGSSGTGLFSDATILNTIYSPSVEDYIAGSVVLTLEVENGVCPIVSDSRTLTLYNLPEVNAGEDIETCMQQLVNLGLANATNYSSLLWNTNGDGSFNDASLLNPVYTPGATDLANGSVVLSLSADPLGSCSGSFTDNLTLTIIPSSVVDAGADQNLCGEGTFTISGAQVQNYESLQWTSSGSGVLANDQNLNPTYTPSTSDIAAGTVSLSLSASNPPCPAVNDQKVLNLHKLPIVNAGGDDAICQTDTYQLNGSSAQHAASVLWTTSGNGSFDDATNLHATYTPGINDILAGTVVLTLKGITSTPCSGNFTDQMTLTIVRTMIVDAGVDTSLCGEVPHLILHNTALNHDDLLWTTSGNGTFDDPTALHPVYTPTMQDVYNGFTTLSCTAYNSHCPPVSDDMILSLYIRPIIYMDDDTVVCSTNPEIDLWDTDVHHYLTINWSTNGSGSFSDETIMQPIYTPSTEDLIAGMVLLTCEADTNTPCDGPFFSDMLVHFQNPATVTAGPEQSFCDYEYQTVLGTTATNQESVSWSSSGSGSFMNEDLLTPQYLPSTADMNAGSAWLYVTASNQTCESAVDSLKVNFHMQVTVDAGMDQSMCSANPLTISEATAIDYSSVHWACSGTGSVQNANSLNPTYIPSPTDVANGSVTLTITAYSNAPCTDVATDEITVSITCAPEVEAGSASGICQGDSLFVSGASAQFYQGFYWTSSGSGSILNPESFEPVYVPSLQDVEAEFVELALNAVSPPCDVVSDFRGLTIIPLPVAYAGVDTVIPSGNSYHNQLAFVDHYSYYMWTSDGSGYFDNPTYANPIYYPSPMDTIRRFV